MRFHHSGSFSNMPSVTTSSLIRFGTVTDLTLLASSLDPSSLLQISPSQLVSYISVQIFMRSRLLPCDSVYWCFLAFFISCGINFIWWGFVLFIFLRYTLFSDLLQAFNLLLILNLLLKIPSFLSEFLLLTFQPMSFQFSILQLAASISLPLFCFYFTHITPIIEFIH